MMKKEIKTLLTFIIYLFAPLLAIYIYKLITGEAYTRSNITAVVWLNGVLDIIFVIIFVIMSIDIFKSAKKVFEGEKKAYDYVGLGAKLVVLFYVVKIVSGMMVIFILRAFGLQEISINQTLVEEAFKIAPIMMFITGAFFAPVTEELVFRGAVRRIIKNKRLFVFVSGLIFGLAHVLRYDLVLFTVIALGYAIDLIITSNIDKKKKYELVFFSCFTMLIVLAMGLNLVLGGLINVLTTINPAEAINGIGYIIIGMYFAYVYAKYDNIYLSIFIHILNNTIAYIVLFTSL